MTMSRREILTRSRPCKTGEWIYTSASLGDSKPFTLGTPLLALLENFQETGFETWQLPYRGRKSERSHVPNNGERATGISDHDGRSPLAAYPLGFLLGNGLVQLLKQGRWFLQALTGAEVGG